MILLPFIAAMIYYVYFVLKAAFALKNAVFLAQSPKHLNISVVVPARNEAASIQKCIQSILTQTYPADKFELIVIDDHSEDETYILASSFLAKYPNISLHKARKTSKKAALQQAIQLSKGDIIVQTDADCQVSPQWLETIATQFDEKTALVSSPVLLSYAPNSIFEALQSLEFIGLNVLGGGSMNSGNPNMCNGANLAYRKKVFEEVNGFQGIDQVASGDDELLLQKIIATQKYQVKYLYHQAAIVNTPAQTSLRSFWRQRTRWVSKSRFYTNRWANFTQVLFLLAIVGVPLALCLGDWQIALLLFLIKCLADLILMRKAINFFQQPHLWWYFLLLEFAYYLYVPIIAIAGNFIGQYEWKGRVTK